MEEKNTLPQKSYFLWSNTICCSSKIQLRKKPILSSKGFSSWNNTRKKIILTTNKYIRIEDLVYDESISFLCKNLRKKKIPSYKICRVQIGCITKQKHAKLSFKLNGLQKKRNTNLSMNIRGVHAQHITRSHWKTR